MYSDDPTIHLFFIKDDIDLYPWNERKQIFIDHGFDTYGCGFFTDGPCRIYDLPNSFYDDLKIPREIRLSYFYIPRIESAKVLADVYKNIPYVIVHEESSMKHLPITRTLRERGETRLLLDLNKNSYSKDHAFWNLAEQVVNKPLIDFTYLIEGAQEIHMIESSIYCLASHLNLENVVRKVCYEPWGENAERLGIFTTGEKLTPI